MADSIDATDPAVRWRGRRAALAAGSVVAVPTDTVYGLAADPSHPEAVARLFALKGRPGDVALPVLVGTRSQVALVAGHLDVAARQLAGRFWPGPLDAGGPDDYPDSPADLGGSPSAGQTVGVRLTRPPGRRRCATRLGPLAVTSANIHGSPPATTAAQVVRYFAGPTSRPLVLDGGTCDGAPSTVVECRGPAVTLGLREGAALGGCCHGARGVGARRSHGARRCRAHWG